MSGSPDEQSEPLYPSELGSSTETSITVLGLDLADDLMGKVGFGELAFWMTAMRRPSSGELRLFEAVLVSLAEHGWTPTAIAARLTLLSAPESIQGALAAGLLGGGSRFLGVTENTGRFLATEVDALEGSYPTTEAEWDEVAKAALERVVAQQRRVPGLGHPIHRTDPRVAALLRIASEEGVVGPHTELFHAIGRVHPQVLGRTLPLNGAGAAGAALADLGMDPALLRGFALLARTAGLLGHIAEEHRAPLARKMYDAIEAGAGSPT